MLINLSYGELLHIAAALTIIENVYGTNTSYDLLGKINHAMECMDNAPLTDVYPGIYRGRGTVLLDLNCPH